MKQIRKILALFLLGIMLLQNFSVTAYAAEIEEGNKAPS